VLATVTTTQTPQITGVTPNPVPPMNGNQALTITGNNFQAGDTLTFVTPEGGTIQSTASKLTVNSHTQITYLINNQNDSGTWAVTVNSPDGSKHSNSGSFTVTGAVAAPTFDPPAGTFSGSVTVHASTTTAGATIRYTANGNDPTSGSTVFPSAGLVLHTTTTLKAKAFKTGMADSPMTSGTYTLRRRK
jgi:hypothetical protein